jgi:hypothetical protein
MGSSPVDWALRRSMVDEGWQRSSSSSELCRLAIPVDGRSLQRREKGEGSNAVLTKGFNDQGKGRVELAAVDNGGSGSRSMAK